VHVRGEDHEAADARPVAGLKHRRKLHLATQRRAVVSLRYAFLGGRAVRHDEPERDRAANQFTDEELANLIMAIATINVWNRISISTRTEPPLAV
jgi:alkylhydroperoxidase family enzyme